MLLGLALVACGQVPSGAATTVSDSLRFEVITERNETLLEVDTQEPQSQAEAESIPAYSYSKGVSALVAAKQRWRSERKCVSCHTNGWGLAAQPVIAPKSDEVAIGRSFAQAYLKKYLDGKVEPSRQHGSTEGMVATAAFLAMSDARSKQGLNSVTREGLDHAWSLLDDSGTWVDWLQCNWPPFESDAEFGPTLMLVALGELAELKQLERADQEGAKRLSAYLKANPPLSLHAKAMRLWAAEDWPDLLRHKDEAAGWRKELLHAQAPDGGWSMASLSGPAWKRDGGEAQTKTSEAYPTAFATYVLLRTAADPHESDRTGSSPVNKGLLWLKSHQRENGEWFTRSPRRDGKHYISRAATAFALMALAEGGQK